MPQVSTALPAWTQNEINRSDVFIQSIVPKTEVELTQSRQEHENNDLLLIPGMFVRHNYCNSN